MAALPEAPTLRNQAEATPVVPEPLPQRVAAVPAPARDPAPRGAQIAEAAVPESVAIPQASQFNRPREDGAFVTPTTDSQPSSVARAALARPVAVSVAIDGPAPQTRSADQPSFGTVATLAAAPEAGTAPNLPSPLTGAAPKTFAEIAAPDPETDAIPVPQPAEAFVDPVKAAEVLALEDAKEAAGPVLDLAQALVPERLQLSTLPTDVSPTQSNGVRLVTGDEVVRVQPGSSGVTESAELPAETAAQGAQITIGEPRRIILDSERRAQESAADESGAIAAAVTASGAPNALRDNAADFDASDERPRFALILIDDPAGGVDRKALAALDMPVTFAVDPTRADAAAVARVYRDAGHEVVLLADSLVLFGTPQDVQIAVTGAMAAVPQAIGVLDSADGGFSGDREALASILPSLSEAGMGFVAFPSGLNSGVTTAAKEGVPTATVYRAIDDEDETAPRITRFLDRATFEAVQDGSVIVVGRTRPDTLAAVQSWRLGNRAESVVAAPLSAVLTAED
ncbi:polysaccharide deacteylase family 2 protein [Jannaschia pohangensis]|uniref:polysaccharide deacteylase family 2 protein n=1 Tax=Jannaschia pohangensis TaxID=390807 RepID=UPI0015877C4B|nr:polysaccharide deacteylase family 2 protein [Jannaschia pohangensis]